MQSLNSKQKYVYANSHFVYILCVLHTDLLGFIIFFPTKYSFPVYVITLWYPDLISEQ